MAFKINISLVSFFHRSPLPSYLILKSGIPLLVTLYSLTSAIDGFVKNLSLVFVVCLILRRRVHVTLLLILRKHSEGDSCNKSAAEKCVSEPKNYLETEEFIPQLVINCDKTDLFWKKIQKRTFITEEEKAVTGHKSMKDSLTRAVMLVVIVK
ncbi:hypothetical protein AVEN_198850-1 [Araneus ventricosus]|uniref:Uncharacterized protein n=1 Tax=Araneus ventricosus TaxID=182803 RepID=A0A4Y2T2P2_ARAVE|nr:hypothetical protein AVEN_198850-1 [Araneus ventricosus]